MDLLVRAVNAIIQTLYPQASLEVFGSFPTAAWVPGASNLDMALCLPEAVLASPQARMEALNALAVALRSNQWVTGRGLHSFPIQLSLSSSVHCIIRLSS